MKAKASHVVEHLAALGDPVRLRLLRLAEQQELAVGELAKVVQLPQSTVSRHLKTLADGGWLERRQEGTASLFRMVPDSLSPAMRGLWNAVRDEVGEREEDDRRLKGVLAERKTDSYAFFGRLGGDWDALRGALFGEGFTSVALLSLLRRDWVVADIGCGTGNVAELIAPCVERVCAVDFSQAMLDAGGKRLASVKNVDFVLGRAEETGLPDACVDAAICALVLHHVGEPQEALREMRRIVRRERGGGKVLVIDMVAHNREEYRRLMGHKHLGFSREWMNDLIRLAGFVDATYQELPLPPDAKGPGLFVATGRVP